MDCNDTFLMPLQAGAGMSAGRAGRSHYGSPGEHSTV